MAAHASHDCKSVRMNHKEMSTMCVLELYWSSPPAAKTEVHGTFLKRHNEHNARTAGRIGWTISPTTTDHAKCRPPVDLFGRLRPWLWQVNTRRAPTSGNCKQERSGDCRIVFRHRTQLHAHTVGGPLRQRQLQTYRQLAWTLPNQRAQQRRHRHTTLCEWHEAAR